MKRGQRYKEKIYSSMVEKEVEFLQFLLFISFCQEHEQLFFNHVIFLKS